MAAGGDLALPPTIQKLTLFPSGRDTWMRIEGDTSGSDISPPTRIGQPVALPGVLPELFQQATLFERPFDTDTTIMDDALERMIEGGADLDVKDLNRGATMLVAFGAADSVR